MKVLSTILLMIVCAVLAAGTFLFVAGPSELLREQVAQAVKMQTGRDLLVTGGSSFTVYPRIGVALSDVVISDPPEMGDAPFVRVARLEVATPLGALLRRNLSLDRLVLNGAIIDLREDAQGRRNWEFAPPKAAVSRARRSDWLGPAIPAPAFKRVQIASADGAVPALASVDGQAPGVAGASGPAISNLQVVNGTLRYESARTGGRQEVTGLDLTAKLTHANSELVLDGKGVWRKEPVRLFATVRSLKSLMEGISPVAIKVSAESGEAQFEGMAALAPMTQLNGRVKTSTPSVRTLAAWLGTPMSPGGGLGASSLTGTMAAKSDFLAFKDMVAVVDGATARGDVSVVRQGDRPLIRGTLSVDKLNLATYLGEGAYQAASGTATTAPASGGITDLLESMDKPTASGGPAEAQHVKPAKGGRPQVKGWSSLPVDLAVMRFADVDLTMDLGKLQFRDIVLDRTRMTATLRSGALSTVIQEAGLYKGRGSGTIELDAGQDVPRLSVQATLEGIDVWPLLKASAGFDRLTGRGTIVVKATGHGLTQQQIAETLTGTAAATLSNGAIVGVDIPAMLRAAQKGQVPQMGASPTEKTDYSDLSGTFAIAQGVAQTQDLKLISAALRVTAAGTVNLGKQLLDLQLRPKFSVAANDQSGSAGIAQALNQLDIPIHVKGPWDAPRANVDVNSVVKDQGQLKKSVEKIGEILKSKEGKEAAKEIGNAVRNLLGR